MTHGGGQGGGSGQQPQGSGQSAGPWRPQASGDPRLPGGGWQPPGHQYGRRQGTWVWWLLGGIALLVLVAIAVAAAFVVTTINAAARPDHGASGPQPSAFPSAPAFEPTPRSTRPSEPAPSTRNRPESFPEVRRAADLPPEQARLLGTEVAVTTSSLRYFVLNGFGKPIYHCVFTVDLENLTDRTIEVGTAFRMAGAPGAEWTGSPKELTPGQKSEAIKGWDGLSPEEVGVSEAQCEGPVELTELTVGG